MFSLGIFLKRAFPEKWEDAAEFNMKFFDPPLFVRNGSGPEQLEKKDYKQRKHDPLNRSATLAVPQP